jgi:hypothetical protein
MRRHRGPLRGLRSRGSLASGRLRQATEDRLRASNVLTARANASVELLPQLFELGVVEPILDDPRQPRGDGGITCAHGVRYS